MGFFDKRVEKDEYGEIYDDEDSRNYEELNDCETTDDIIESLRNTVGRGDCIYCGSINAMEYEGNICFICSSCGKSVHEDTYYRWLAGETIEFED